MRHQRFILSREGRARASCRICSAAALPCSSFCTWQYQLAASQMCSLLQTWVSAASSPLCALMGFVARFSCQSWWRSFKSHFPPYTQHECTLNLYWMPKTYSNGIWDDYTTEAWPCPLGTINLLLPQFVLYDLHVCDQVNELLCTHSPLPSLPWLWTLKGWISKKVLQIWTILFSIYCSSLGGQPEHWAGMSHFSDQHLDFYSEPLAWLPDRKLDSEMRKNCLFWICQFSAIVKSWPVSRTQTHLLSLILTGCKKIILPKFFQLIITEVFCSTAQQGEHFT